GGDCGSNEALLHCSMMIDALARGGPSPKPPLRSLLGATMPNNLPTATDTAYRHLITSPRVHGVFSRASMVEAAQALGVAGWVRNRRDGTVEAVLAGESQAVAALLAWARQGPAQARVDQVQVELGNEENHVGFTARETI